MKPQKESLECRGAGAPGEDRHPGDSQNDGKNWSQLKEVRPGTAVQEKAPPRQPKKVIFLSKCSSALGAVDLFLGGDEESELYHTRHVSSDHDTDRAFAVPTGQRAASASAGSSSCLSSPAGSSEPGVGTVPSSLREGYPACATSGASLSSPCVSLCPEGESKVGRGLPEPPRPRPPFISTAGSTRVVFPVPGASDEAFLEEERRAKAPDSGGDCRELKGEGSSNVQPSEKPLDGVHSARTKALQEGGSAVQSGTGAQEAASAQWFSSSRASERFADAEIRELTSAREKEEAGSAVPSFVLGSVVERQGRRTSKPQTAEFSLRQTTPDLLGLSEGVQAAPVRQGKEGTDCLPSHAAIEAPFGFPKAVHRSLLGEGARKERGVRREKGKQNRAPDDVPGQDEECIAALHRTGDGKQTSADALRETCRSRRVHQYSDGEGGRHDSWHADIERENIQRVARMQPHEIIEAQEEILARFGPQRVAALRKRALRRRKEAERDGREGRNSGSGVLETAATTNEKKTEEESNVHVLTTASAVQKKTPRDGTASLSGGMFNIQASASGKFASCDRKNGGGSLVRTTAQGDPMKREAGEQAGAAVQCIIEWGAGPRSRAPPQERRSGGGEREDDAAAAATAAAADDRGPSSVKAGQAQSNSHPRVALPGGRVKFDIQEAAKLQWANPLGAEDLEGGAVGGREGNDKEQRGGEGSMRVWIERLRFDFDGKLRSRIFALGDAARRQELPPSGSAEQEGVRASPRPAAATTLLSPSRDFCSSSDCCLASAARCTGKATESFAVQPSEATQHSSLSASGNGPGGRDPLEFHRGLHHHGDAAALPGYTLGELLHLSQSASRPQAALAVRTLGEVLANARTVISTGDGDHRSGRSVSWTERVPENKRTPPFRGGFGVGLQRWLRYVLRDLFVVWRLGALLHVQSPVIHREALGALAALLGPPTRSCSLGGSGCSSGEEGTEHAETGGRWCWGSLCWGATSICPLFVEPQRGRNSGVMRPAYSVTDHSTTVGDHFSKQGKGSIETFPPVTDSQSKESQQRSERDLGLCQPSPVLALGKETDPEQSRPLLSQQTAQGNVVVPSDQGLEELPCEGMEAGVGKATKHGELPNGADEAQGRCCRSPETGGEGEGPRQEAGHSRREWERVSVYPLGGLDFVEESLPEPLPLSSWVGPAGRAEEREGCGSVFSFWQALLLRVKGSAETAPRGAPSVKKREAKVAFDAPAGAWEDDEDGEDDAASMGEVYYRHPVSSLFTWSGLPSRLAFLLGLYEGDVAIERDCLAVLVGSCVAGPVVSAQMVSHQPLRDRIAILAESLVVGSAARGRRVQREETQKKIRPAEKDAGVARVSARDMFRHMVSSRRAEVAAFATACGRQLTRGERHLACDLLLLLRVLARWTDGPGGGSAREDACENCWFRTFSPCYAIANQSLMEGLSVLIETREEASAESAEKGGCLMQGGPTGQEGRKEETAQPARLGCATTGRTLTTEVPRQGFCEEESCSTSMSLPEVALAPASSSFSFATDVRQLLSAVEALRFKRTLVSRNCLDDEFLDFFPSLSLYVHTFVRRLHQLYGEALLADLASNDLLGLSSLGDAGIERGADGGCSWFSSTGTASSSLQTVTAPPSAALPEIQTRVQGSVADGGAPQRQALGENSSAEAAVEGQRHCEERGSRVPQSDERVRSDLLVQTEAAWTFYGGLAREIFLWATLGVERRRTRDVLEADTPATTTAGFEGASLLGPASAVLKALCQHYPPQAKSVSSAAALRVGEAALRFHLSCTFNTIFRLYPSSSTPVNGRLLPRKDTDGREGRAGLSKADCHTILRGKEEDRASEKQEQTVDRESELLYSRWRRSVQPVIGVLLGADGKMPLPSCIDKKTSSGDGQIHTGRGDFGQCSGDDGSAAILSSFSTQLLMAFLRKCAGKDGELLARSMAQYIAETGWSTLRRCCRQPEACPVSTLGERGVHGWKMAGSRRACWRGIIPATSERFLPPRWKKAGKAMCAQCSCGPSGSCLNGVQQTLTNNANLCCGCLCGSESSGASPSSGVQEKSLEFPDPLEVELFLTQAGFLTTLADYLSSTLYLLARTPRHSRNPSLRGGISPESNCELERDLEGILDAARGSLVAVVTCLCRALRRFLIHLFRQLRWPGIDTPAPHQGASRPLASQGTTSPPYTGSPTAGGTTTTPTSGASSEPAGTAGYTPSRLSERPQASQRTGEPRKDCDTRKTLGPDRKEPEAKCWGTQGDSAPGPAVASARQHEASVTSGPLLLCDRLALLMLALLGLRRACTPEETGAIDGAGPPGRESSSGARSIPQPTAGPGKCQQAGCWTLEDEQQCIVAACSAASTSWTLLKCVAWLYATQKDLSLGSSMSLWPAQNSQSRGVTNLTSESAWLRAAARWIGMCCCPPERPRRSAVRGQHGGGGRESGRGDRAADSITTQAWSCLVRVAEELKQAERPSGRIAQRLSWPPPLCVLRSLSSCCRSQAPGRDVRHGCVDVEGHADGAENLEGANLRAPDAERRAESGHGVLRRPCMPCQTLFVSPIDVLIGGSLLDALLGTSGGGAPSRQQKDASSASGTVEQQRDNGESGECVDGYGPNETSSGLSRFIRLMPSVAVDLCNYVLPVTVLAVLVLFYSESGADKQMSCEPDSPVSSSTETAGVGGLLSSSISDVYAQPDSLNNFWWMLDVWLLEPLGCALRDGDGTGPRELSRVSEFSDAFVNVWERVEEAWAQRQIKGNGTDLCTEGQHSAESEEVWTPQLGRCAADWAKQPCGHGTCDGRSGESRVPLSQREEIVGACPVHACVARLPAVRPQFPLCCAKAQDVLLSKTARLLFIAQSAADAADPVLLLLLWLLSSPAFPLDCREMILADTAFLALADKTFCFGRDNVQWTDFPVNGQGPSDPAFLPGGTRVECQVSCTSAEGAPQEESAADGGGDSSFRSPRSTFSSTEHCRPENSKIDKAPGFPNARNDTWGHRRAEGAGCVGAKGAQACWGVVTPYGEVLWAISKGSRRLLQPGEFLCDEDDKILRSYRCFLATQMARHSRTVHISAGCEPHAGGLRSASEAGLMTLHALAALVGEALLCRVSPRRARGRSEAPAFRRAGSRPGRSGSLERDAEEFKRRAVRNLTKQLFQQAAATASAIKSCSERAGTLAPADVETIVLGFATTVEACVALNRMQAPSDFSSAESGQLPQTGVSRKCSPERLCRSRF